MVTERCVQSVGQRPVWETDPSPMLKFSRIALVAVIAALGGGGAWAEPVQLGEADIRQMLPGSTIELDTPLGVRLPISFTADGLMTGEAGRLEPYLGTARDRGRWWAADGKLCQKWFRWFEAKPRCVSVTRSGQRIRWQEAGGESGTATIVAEGPTRPQEPAAEQQQSIAAAAMTPSLPRPAKVAKPVQPTVPVQSTAAAKPAVVARPTIQDSQPEDPNVGGTPRFAAPALAAATRGAAQPEAETNIAQAATQSTSQGRTAVATAVRRAVTRTARTQRAQNNRFNPPIPLPTRRIVEKPPALPSQLAAAAAASGHTFRVRGVMSNDLLNVRNGPSEQHNVIGGLAPGSGNVRIVGRCIEDWCEVASPRIGGWVNVVFLTPERRTARRRFDPFRQGLGATFASGS